MNMCDSTKKKMSEIEEDSTVQCTSANCPFWGRQSTNNLCSQCYKQSLDSLANPPQLKPSTTASALESSSTTLDTKNASFVSSVHSSLNRSLSDFNSSTSEKQVASTPPVTIKSSHVVPKPESSLKTVHTSSPVSLAQSFVETEQSFELSKVARTQKDKRRCLECNKFLGISGFTCRCDFTFCGQHRVPEKHACAFDFEKLAREKFLKFSTNDGANFDKFKNDTEKL